MEKKFMYCNVASLACSPYDINMTFTTVRPGEDNQVEKVDEIDIVMSMTHAKLFSKGLLQQIEQYEEKFGEIDISKIVVEED